MSSYCTLLYERKCFAYNLLYSTHTTRIVIMFRDRRVVCFYSLLLAKGKQVLCEAMVGLDSLL